MKIWSDPESSNLSEGLKKNNPLFWILALEVGMCVGFLTAFLEADAFNLGIGFLKQDSILYAILLNIIKLMVTLNCKLLALIGLIWLAERTMEDGV